MRGCGLTGGCSVSRFDDVRHAVSGYLAASDVDDCPGNDADHIVQKAVSCETNRHQAVVSIRRISTEMISLIRMLLFLSFSGSC